MNDLVDMQVGGLELDTNSNSTSPAFNETPTVPEEFSAPIASLTGMKGSPTLLNYMSSMVASARTQMDPSLQFGDVYNDVRGSIASMDDPAEAAAALRDQYLNYFKGNTDKLVIDNISTVDFADAVGFGVAAQEIKQEEEEELDVQDVIPLINKKLSLENEVDSFDTVMEFSQYLVAQKMVDTTSLENFGNALAFIIPDLPFDSADLTGSFSFTGDNIKQMAFEFQSLTFEEQVAALPALVNLVFDVNDSNELKAATRLMNIIDPNATAKTGEEFALAWTEAALIAGPMFPTKLTSMIKGLNPISAMKRSGNTEKAAEVNARVLSDTSGEVTNVTGVSQHTAAMNAHPIQYSQIDPGSTDGIAAATQKVLDQTDIHRAKIQAQMKDTVNKENFLQSSVLTESDKLLVQNKALNGVGELLDEYKQSGRHIEEAAIIEQNPNGFKMSYKVDGVKSTQQFTYELNKHMQWDVNGVGILKSAVLSPNTLLRKVEDGLVEEASRLNISQSAILDDLSKAYKIAVEPLGSRFSPSGMKARVNLDDILIAGDDAERVFSPKELMHEGIKTENGIRYLSASEVPAYYGMRDVMDTTFFIRNGMVRDALKAQGFKEVKLSSELEGASIGTEVIRPFKKVSDIPTAVREGDITVWSAQKEGKISHISSLDLDDLYNKGFVLGKFNKASNIGDSSYNYALVQTKNVKSLRTNVLNRRDGYIPKIHETGFYFVKKISDGMIDGKKVTGGSKITVSRHERKQDADAFMLEQNNLSDGRNKYEVLHDRQLSLAEREEEIIRTEGGLFTGARARHDIVNDFNGRTVERTSALEAIERDLSNISNHIPMNEFRLRMQKTFTNTFSKELDDSTDFNSPLKSEALSTVKGQNAEAMRTWIRDQLRIPTDKERQWEATTRYIAEWMEGKPLLDNSIRRSIQVMGHRDPFSAMRAMAFNSLLGWFNPVQLWVQAQGSSIALAIDPIGAPKHIAQYMALRGALYLKSDKAIIATGKAAGMGDEFLDTVKAWQKTGLHKSLLATADHNATVQAYGMGAAVMRSAAAKGRIFFNEGELFSRGFSWLTARTRYLKNNPGAKMDNPIAQKAIMDDTLAMTLNMTRANRAYWQKGIWSLPLQFTQPMTKFVENMLPNIMRGSTGKFKGSEKGRILMGQMLLYGTAGIPMGKWMASTALPMAGIQSDDINSAKAQASLTNGFWGWAAYEVFGTGVEVGVRGSLANGVFDMSQRLLAEDMSLPVTMAGAFGAVPQRAWQAMERVFPLMVDPTSVDWNGNDVLFALEGVSNILSSMNNVNKTRLWNKLQLVTNSAGSPLFPLDDSDMGILWAQALGFEPTRVADLRDISKFQDNKRNRIQRSTKAYQFAVNRYLAIASEGAVKDSDSNSLYHVEKILLQFMTPIEFSQMKNKVWKNLNNPTNREEKARQIFLQRIADGADLTEGQEGIFSNTAIQEIK